MRLYRNHFIDLLRKSMEWFLYNPKYSLVCVKPKIINKIFRTNCSFHVKWRATGKVKFLFFKSFLIVTINKAFILVGRLNNGLLFYRVFWLSWYFLLSWGAGSFCVCVCVCVVGGGAGARPASKMLGSFSRSVVKSWSLKLFGNPIVHPCMPCL